MTEMTEVTEVTEVTTMRESFEALVEEAARDAGGYWHAEVTFALRREGAHDAELQQRLQSLVGSGLPANVVTDTVGVTLQFAVPGTTLRGASLAALAIAGKTRGGPQRVSVMPLGEYLRLDAHPERLALAGQAEVADILGISGVRAGQLADDHPRFPAPLAKLRQGRVWTVASINAFNATWTRTAGRPRKGT